MSRRGFIHYIEYTMKIAAYRLRGLSPLEHLTVENIFLETCGAESVLLFYVNSPCVVIGRNQNPWREMAPGCALPFFRRDSGGGAVYHDEGNLNWALIVPRAAHSQQDELAAMAAAISAQGFDIVPGSRGGLYCGPGSAYAGLKVSGTARRFGSKAVLHHGTILVGADMARLRASLGGIETYDDISMPSVPASPVNLSDMKPAVDMEALAEGLSLYLTGAPCAPLPPAISGYRRFGEIQLRLSSEEWLYAATPSFSFLIRGQGLSLSLRVERGKVADFTAECNDVAQLSYCMGKLGDFKNVSFSFGFIDTLGDIIASAAMRRKEAS